MTNTTLDLPSAPVSIEYRPDGSYRLQAATVVPVPIKQVFDFFADAFNLERITPPWIRFKVITPPPIQMHQGLLIDYRLHIHGLPLRWQSEISLWDPPNAFVDEQRRGPYQLWHHTHRFEDLGDHTRVTDEVRYAVPGGRWLHDLIVKRDLFRIFTYRQKTLMQLLESDPHP